MREVDFEATFHRIADLAKKKADQFEMQMANMPNTKEYQQRERRRQWHRAKRLCAVCGSQLRRPKKFTRCARCTP